MFKMFYVALKLISSIFFFVSLLPQHFAFYPKKGHGKYPHIRGYFFEVNKNFF